MVNKWPDTDPRASNHFRAVTINNIDTKPGRARARIAIPSDLVHWFGVGKQPFGDLLVMLLISRIPECTMTYPNANDWWPTY